MVASAVKSHTIFIVTLSCGRVLSERALWPLLSTAARGAERKGEEPGSGVQRFWGPLGGLGIRPLVSAIRGLGNLLPGAP